MRGEERGEALAEWFILAADGGEEGVAFGRGLFQGQRKEHFFPVLRRWHIRIGFGHSRLHAHYADKKYESKWHILFAG